MAEPPRPECDLCVNEVAEKFREPPPNVSGRPGSVLFLPLDFRGPTCLASGDLTGPTEERIGEIMAGNSQEEKPGYQLKKQIPGKDESIILVNKKFGKKAAAKLQIGG
jgi:hypothetical protein